MNLKLTTRLAVVALGGLLATNALAQNLISNPGFETPSQGTGYTGYTTGSTNITGWTVDTNLPDGATLFSVGACSTYGVANDGSQILQLCGAPSYTTGGGVHQTITTVSNQTYIISIAVAYRTAASSGNFSFGGQNHALSASTTSYVTNTWTVTATNTSPVIDITGSTSSSANQLLIDNVSVTPALDPGIAIQPASQTVQPGQTATFSVTATGTSPFSYQWQATNSATGGFTNLVNGGQIAGAKTNVLTVSNASTNNLQFYQVIVTNVNGSITSSVVSLTVNSTLLINADIGTGGGTQTGAAILGQAGDVWNVVSLGTITTVVNSGNSTLSGVTIGDSAAGNYATPSPAVDAATAALMSDFNYNTPGSGPVPVTITGLGAYVNQPFTLVVYAGMDPSQACTENITAGATGGNTASTLNTTSATRKLSDGIGVAYNTFTGTLTNGTLTFTVSGTSYHGPNGFQLQVQFPNPGIASQPVSRTNVVGTAATFSVAATGNAPFSYQWQATNSASGGFTNLVDVVGVVSGSQSNLLTFPNVATSQALTYQVIVTNSYGSVTSSPATLAVLTIPIITNQPVSQTVLSGSTVSYTVGATGIGTLGYQWQATNSASGGFTNILGATTNILSLGVVTSNSAVSYQVIVANANGSVTSTPAFLTVLSATQLIDVDIGVGALQTGAAVLGAAGDVWNGFTANLANVTNAAGSALGGVGITMSGQAGVNANTPPPGGTPMDAATVPLMEDYAYLTAAGTITMNVTGLGAYNGSQYTLEVYAAGDTASPSQGASLAVTAGVTGGNSTNTLTTSAASRKLSDGPGVAYQTFTGTLTNGTLTFTATRLAGSTYLGLNGFQLLLAPSVPPIITSQPISQTNVQSATVSFSVGAAAAGGTLSYQWQTNGVNVGNNGHFSGSTSNVLTVSNISTNDALSYQVVVSTAGGSVTSSPALLTVLQTPLITTQPVSQVVLDGGTATFNVVAGGVGPLTYQWLTNGVPLGNGGTLPTVSGATTNTLTLTGVNTNWALNYQVVVSNGNGSVTSTPAATLTVLPATQLINGDEGLTGQTPQTGGAVLGTSGDVWNPLFLTAGTIINSTSNTVNGVGYLIAGGISISANTGGSPMDATTTPLMADFVFGGSGNPASFQITGLNLYSNSPFALVVYAAEDTVGEGATLTLTGATGGNTTNTLATTGASRQISAGPGVAYQVFTGILTNGTLQVTAGVLTNENNAAINGFQLLLSPTLPPIFTNAPVSQTVTAGTPVTFTSGVVGTAPFGYQWLTNGVPIGNGGGINGATSNILTIASASSSLALSYSVVVTNSHGSVTSYPAILSILRPPALVGEWFTGAQSLADQSGFTPAGTHDGVDDIGFENAQWASGDAPVGHTGSSIAFDGNYAVGITNSLNTDPNYQTTFDQILSKKMTIAFWAKYTAPVGGSPFVAKNGTSVGWQFQSDTTTTNPEFTLKGTSTANLQSTSNITDGNWHHYAGTWDGTTGIRSVYIDGVLTASLTGDLGTMTTAGNYRLVLGGIDTVGTGDGTIPIPYFTGQLYDVRIYNYALSLAQVQTLAGVTPTVSTNAYLSSLTVSPAGTLSPTFASNVLSYVTTEAYGNTPTITVVDADLTATNHLIYLGATNLLASGVASSALTLNSNPAVTNVVKVVVTAQDGVTTQNYLVNVVQLPSQTKPVLANSVSSGSLNLNWPLDHLGYRLLTQTNNLAKGVSANSNDWATVVGSSLTNTFTTPIVKTNLNQYYRLIYP